MNHVESEDQRDMQPALLHRKMLEAIDLLGIGYEQERSHLALQNQFIAELLVGCIERNLAHLPYLFFKCHFMNEVVYKTTCNGPVRECGFHAGSALRFCFQREGLCSGMRKTKANHAKPAQHT